MSNNINNNHESVENIFNAFLMGGKMNTASKQERAKIVDTFMEQAKSCFVDTENTVKYLNVLMERTRLRYGFTADEFAAMLGYSSTAAYNKTFMQPNANFGTVVFPYVVHFAICLAIICQFLIPCLLRKQWQTYILWNWLLF